MVFFFFSIIFRSNVHTVSHITTVASFFYDVYRILTRQPRASLQNPDLVTRVLCTELQVNHHKPRPARRLLAVGSGFQSPAAAAAAPVSVSRARGRTRSADRRSASVRLAAVVVFVALSKPFAILLSPRPLDNRYSYFPGPRRIGDVNVILFTTAVVAFSRTLFVISGGSFAQQVTRVHDTL